MIPEPDPRPDDGTGTPHHRLHRALAAHHGAVRRAHAAGRLEALHARRAQEPPPPPPEPPGRS